MAAFCMDYLQDGCFLHSINKAAKIVNETRKKDTLTNFN